MVKFKDWTEEFMGLVPHAERNSAGEIAQKELCTKNHLVPFFGECDLDQITAWQITAYKGLKIKAGLAPKTINNHLTILRTMLNTAVEGPRYITSAPAIKKLPKAPKKVRFLTKDEIARLLEAASDEHPWQEMITLALHTGLRVGELQALRWRAIDLKARQLEVLESVCRIEQTAKAPKNDRFRTIPLNDPAHDMLRTYLRTGEVVFGKRPHGEPYTYMGCQHALVRIAKQAGIEDMGWHTLRHTFASQLVTAGVPLYHVRDLLGHSTLAMTEVYAHLASASGVEAVNALAAALAEDTTET